MSAFERCPVPVVAAVHGACVGAGAALPGLLRTRCCLPPWLPCASWARACSSPPLVPPLLPRTRTPTTTTLLAMPCPLARRGPGHRLRHPAGHRRRRLLRQGAPAGPCVCLPAHAHADRSRPACAAPPWRRSGRPAGAAAKRHLRASLLLPSLHAPQEADLAIVADMGTLQRLPALVGHGVASELALTARTFSGAPGWGGGSCLCCGCGCWTAGHALRTRAGEPGLLTRPGPPPPLRPLRAQQAPRPGSCASSARPSPARPRCRRGRWRWRGPSPPSRRWRWWAPSGCCSSSGELGGSAGMRAGRRSGAAAATLAATAASCTRAALPSTHCPLPGAPPRPACCATLQRPQRGRRAGLCGHLERGHAAAVCRCGGGGGGARAAPPPALRAPVRAQQAVSARVGARALPCAARVAGSCWQWWWAAEKTGRAETGTSVCGLAASQPPVLDPCRIPGAAPPGHVSHLPGL